jgi:hypothetical protein
MKWIIVGMVIDRGKPDYCKREIWSIATSKIIASWDIAPCSHVEVDGRFRGSHCFHDQGDYGDATLRFVQRFRSPPRKLSPSYSSQ